MPPATAAPVRTNRRNLVAQVVAELRKTIGSGHYAIGDKLPSEAQLTDLYSVSRTVIREAIASLRADGLLESRQGAGVFVVANQAPGSTAFHMIDTQRVSSMIEILELRTAVELEAASLAASRRSPAQEEAIYEMHDTFNRQVAAGEAATDADIAFHLAIADATNNPRFREILEMLGSAVIPRLSVQNRDAEPTPSSYLEHIGQEHQRIADAISAGDEQAARDAMRVHLRGSQKRYRSLLRGNK